MFSKKFFAAGLLSVAVAGVICTPVSALDVGFTGLLTAESSDNLFGDNAPDEEAGETVTGVLGIYGEQRGTRVRAGFLGEIDNRQRFAEIQDDDSSTLTRFLGAAEWAITPRSWKWYVGDILGGVRSSSDTLAINETDTERRNVFMTGPSFEYEIEGVSRTDSRLLYVHQSEESTTLESLYIGDFSYQRETIPGSYYGISLGNVFTDNPDEDSEGQPLDTDTDFNRFTGSLFLNRARGFWELYGELGATRYDTNDESLDGVRAQLRATRLLGPQSSFSVELNRDVNDQTLSTIESLISSGNDALGVEPDVSGFFEETRLSASYSLQTAGTSLDLGASVGQLDYRLLNSNSAFTFNADSEDRASASAFGTLSKRLSVRWRAELGFSLERQDYDNRVDESDAVLAGAQLVYQLSRSFELQGGFVHDRADGIRTRVSGEESVTEDIDVTENRISLGIRWAPPSRASQDLTVELKSLLQ